MASLIGVGWGILLWSSPGLRDGTSVNQFESFAVGSSPTDDGRTRFVTP